MFEIVRTPIMFKNYSISQAFLRRFMKMTNLKNSCDSFSLY